MAKYIVTYAKIVVEKDEGITLAGVYLGGISESQKEADTIARECVNTIRGGTILPKIAELAVDDLLLDAMYDATEKFERITANMVESSNVINRKKK